MNDADRDAIQDLFARLSAAEASSPTRDPAAEAYIRDRLQQNPAAAYYMAQTVIAQEHALRAARDRIAAAEGDDGHYAQPVEQRSGGGFFGNLFGGGDRRPVPQRPGPWDQPAQAGMLSRGAGGGFLAGAAQTAVGVAGGMMLGNMLTDLFEGDHGGGRQSFVDDNGGFGGGQGLGDFGGDSAGFGDDGAGGFFDDQG